ncbi:hypothetical protein SAMN05216267_10995, partial [Actinacidiphila rubida]
MFTPLKPLKKSALAVAVAAAAASGLSVLPAHAQTPAGARARHQMAVTLDHVAVQVSGPDVPVGVTPYVADPGNSVQVASMSSTKPYSYLSVMAVPFGETLPQSIYAFPESKAGDTAAWTRALHGTPNGPVATIFGQKVRGTIVRSHGNLTGKRGSRTDIRAIEWVVDQGGRTWVVNLQHDQSVLPAGFGTGLTVSSGNSAAHTSVDVKRLSATAPASLVRTPMMQSNDVPLGGDLGLPSWWNSTCDGNGSPLGSSGTFMGLQVCGGGTDKNDLVPGKQQLEWQCADLSDRYLVQRYGLNGPGGNGNQEAANWYNAYPGKFQLHSNGDHAAPVAGDVISFAVGAAANGHTGVVYSSSVDSSGNGMVYFVDQNWTGDNGYNKASVSNWNVEERTGEGGTVQWLHDPNSATPPVASVSGPGAGSVVRGAVTLSASASDSVGTVDQVQFLVDGTAVGTATSAPYHVTWNTLTVPPGAHTITVRAHNTAGQWGAVSSPQPVTVSPSSAISNAVVEPNGTTDVFTRAASTGHLVNTYRDGTGWHVSDLTAGTLGTPALTGRAAAVVQPNDNVDVLTVNTTGGHLTNTWRDSTGWHVTDLTSSLGTPAATGSPTAIVQPNGNTDILTINTTSGHLTNTWSDSTGWHVTDLTTSLGTPAATGTPTAITEPNGNVD